MDDDYWSQVRDDPRINDREIDDEEAARKEAEIQRAITFLTDNGYIVIEEPPF